MIFKILNIKLYSIFHHNKYNNKMNKINFSDKYQLIVKPTQSGKTFIVLSEIKKIFIQNKDNNTRIINILFCDNSLLQTDQLKSRIDDELPIFTDNNGEQSVILSSKSDIKNYESLFTVIFDSDCNNIITCANNARVENIDKLIVNRMKKKDNITKFYLWIDESDKTFSRIDKNNLLKKWENYSNVVKISFITATPEEHFKKQFEEINIFKLDTVYNEELYHSFKNSNFIFTKKEDKLDNTFDNICNILTNYPHNKGEVWFIPGNVNVVSHYEIKDYLILYGFNVFIINGTEKGLYNENNQLVELFDCNNEDNNLQELSKIIGIIYEKYNLKSKKVAITGNLCISRGITINSNKMLISHVIFPQIKDENSAYQLAGRICGNYKKNDNFIIPNVYISEKLKDQICKMEELAIKIPQYDKMSFDQYFTLKLDIIEVIVIDTLRKYEDVIKYYKTHLKNKLSGSGPNKNRIFEESTEKIGFLMSTIRDETKVFTKKEVLDNKRWGINQKNKWRCHVCYEDINNPESILYLLIHIKIDEINISKNDIENISSENDSKNISNINNIKDINDNMSNKKIVRPKDCNIFNSDTIIRHKKANFEEFAIYSLKDKLLYRCNVDGTILSKDESFKTFNSFSVSNYIAYSSGKNSKNAYKNLEYFNKSLNKFISMKNVRDNEFLN